MCKLFIKIFSGRKFRSSKTHSTLQVCVYLPFAGDWIPSEVVCSTEVGIVSFSPVMLVEDSVWADTVDVNVAVVLPENRLQFMLLFDVNYLFYS